MCNALRVRPAAQWQLIFNDFPAWEAVYQHMRRYWDSGCFEAIVNDLRSILPVASSVQQRFFDERALAILDANAKKATWCYSYNTPRLMLPVQVHTANKLKHAEVHFVAQEVQHVNGKSVTLAFRSSRITGQEPAQAAPLARKKGWNRTGYDGQKDEKRLCLASAPVG